TGSARTTAEELYARAGAVWGDGFTTAGVARAQGWCSGYVYDAAKVTLRADGGRVVVEGEMLGSEPGCLGRTSTRRRFWRDRAGRRVRSSSSQTFPECSRPVLGIVSPTCARRPTPPSPDGPRGSTAC